MFVDSLVQRSRGLADVKLLAGTIEAVDHPGAFQGVERRSVAFVEQFAADTSFLAKGNADSLGVQGTLKGH